MKSIIVYSSLTGNTKKLAEAIHEKYPKFDIRSIDECADISEYDLIFLGYWVNRGTADEACLNVLNNSQSNKIATFGTSGQYPDSDASIKYCNRVKALVQDKNEYMGGFICQGKIEESRTEKRKRIPQGQSHYLTEEGLRRHLESRKHPDEEDINRLLLWVEDVLEVYNG